MGALAVGTQKKIQKEGMEPKNTLREAIPKILDEIRQELDKVDLNDNYTGDSEFDGPGY